VKHLNRPALIVTNLMMEVNVKTALFSDGKPGHSKHKMVIVLGKRYE